jgi:pyridoxamine 5'-phosphate oxidase
MTDPRDMRREYLAGPLRRNGLAADPLEQFQRWLEAADAAGLRDATAMALATANADGEPTVRIVLLKHCDDEGFCWYTDHRSRKGIDLTDNPRAELLFHWRELDRQARVSGCVERLDDATAQRYFDSRPDDSRFSAAASVQSAPVRDRNTLEEAVAELRRRHPDGRVPKPPAWGGYRLRPRRYEFWQGREGRLHDRFQYTWTGAVWRVSRLQP